MNMLEVKLNLEMIIYSSIKEDLLKNWKGIWSGHCKSKIQEYSNDF